MDGVGQRFQQGGGFAHPIRQCRAVDVEPVALEDLALPVERQVICVFVDQHMGQQTGPGSATFDRAAWQWGLREAIAARAGHPWAHNAVHDEAAGDVFQFLGHILAQQAQLTAAIGAGRVAGGQFDHHARNMIGDRLALGFVGGGILRQAQLGGQRGDGDLARLQGQLQLFGRLG